MNRVYKLGDTVTRRINKPYSTEPLKVIAWDRIRNMPVFDYGIWSYEYFILTTKEQVDETNRVKS